MTIIQELTVRYLAIVNKNFETVKALKFRGNIVMLVDMETGHVSYWNSEDMKELIEETGEAQVSKVGDMGNLLKIINLN